MTPHVFFGWHPIRIDSECVMGNPINMILKKGTSHIELMKATWNRFSLHDKYCQLNLYVNFNKYYTHENCALSCFYLRSSWAPCRWLCVTGSRWGCIHWTPPFLIDLVFLIFFPYFDIIILVWRQSV
jgi:hypothetical protein